MQFMPSLRQKAQSQTRSGDLKSYDTRGRGVTFSSGIDPKESEEGDRVSSLCRCALENQGESQVRELPWGRGPKKTMEFMPSLRQKAANLERNKSKERSKSPLKERSNSPLKEERGRSPVNERKFEEVKISKSGCMCTCKCNQLQQQEEEGDKEGKRRYKGAGEGGSSRSRSRGAGGEGGRKEWWMPSVRQRKSRSRSRSASNSNNNNCNNSNSTGRKQSKGGSLSVSPERRVALGSLRHPSGQRL